MIPLLLFLGLAGVALTAYEVAPKLKTRVDVYVHAMQAAHAANQAADVHLNNATQSIATAQRHAEQADAAAQQQPEGVSPPTSPTIPPPTAPPPTAPPTQAEAQANAAQSAADAAVDHTAAADEATKAAAAAAATAAAAAQSAEEKRAADEQAAKARARQQQIEQAFSTLGVGQCDARTYTRVTARVRDEVIRRLRADQMAVTGDNPWNIDTHTYGVKLRAVWNPNTESLKVIVTAGKGTEVDPFGIKKVNCDDIWGKIEPILKSLGAVR